MCENTQLLSLENRRTLFLSGVHEIISFTDDLIILYTNMGNLHIRGSDLEISSAFAESGEVEINGYIQALLYSENREKTADNIISRIFR